MSNFPEDSPQLSMMEPELIPEPADEMSALEERILRAVEMVKRERQLRMAAEQKLAQLESQAQSVTGRVPALEAEIVTLKQERSLVRQRVERLLKHLDELSA